jgi:TonB family protein
MMAKMQPWLLGLALLAILTQSASGQAGQRSRGDCDGRIISLDTVPDTHSQPPYPPISKRLNEQGSSVFRVTIGRSGQVEETAMEKSSGSDRLDAAAQDWVRQNWRWQGGGTVCRRLATIVTIDWRLIDAEPGP